MSGKNLLWAGRISPEKRPEDAIQVFRQVYERFSDATLTIVGKGERRALWKDEILIQLQKRVVERWHKDTAALKEMIEARAWFRDLYHKQQQECENILAERESAKQRNQELEAELHAMKERMDLLPDAKKGLKHLGGWLKHQLRKGR